jgi:Holliday junction resolvase RusA-like endonuclease
VKIRVHGLPAPQGSKRHLGGGRMVESSAKVYPWREAVVSELKRCDFDGRMLDGPVSVRVVFYLPRPQSHLTPAKQLRAAAPRYPHRPPDLDKLLRSTFDAFTQAGVVADDSRIVIVAAAKKYASRNEPPGAEILITEVEELP